MVGGRAAVIRRCGFRVAVIQYWAWFGIKSKRLWGMVLTGALFFVIMKMEIIWKEYSQMYKRKVFYYVSPNDRRSFRGKIR